MTGKTFRKPCHILIYWLNHKSYVNGMNICIIFWMNILAITHLCIYLQLLYITGSIYVLTTFLIKYPLPLSLPKTVCIPFLNESFHFGTWFIFTLCVLFIHPISICSCWYAAGYYLPKEEEPGFLEIRPLCSSHMSVVVFR